MKKLLLSSLAVAALSLASLSASAGQTLASDGAFTVTVALTSTCKVDNTTSQVIAFGPYTALTNVDKTASLTFKIKCTRGLAIGVPTLAFDTAGGGNNGVVAGLNYTLSYTNTALSNTSGTEASAATPTLGTPATFVYNVKGDMVGLQAGNEGIAALSSTDSRTITVTY